MFSLGCELLSSEKIPGKVCVKMANFRTKQYLNMRFSTKCVFQYIESSPPVGLIIPAVLGGIADNNMVLRRATEPIKNNFANIRAHQSNY